MKQHNRRLDATAVKGPIDIQIDNGVKVVIDRLIAVGGETGEQELVTTHDADEIEIRSCDLSSWRGALLQQ